MKRLLTIIISMLFFVPAAFLAITWNRIPEKVPMQFGWDGEVNRYGSKFELIFVVILLTVVNIGVYLLLRNVHKIDPKRYGAENQSRMTRLASVISIFITGILCFILYCSINQTIKPDASFILGAVGVLFCFIGNYMFNIKPNYFAGFRLPWTLESEENWRLTHNLAGKLWFAGGVVMAVLALLLPEKIAFVIFFVIVAILVIVPLIYSYKIFRRSRATK